ncbi:cell division protein FtsQ/DivIB [Chryseobacterium sp. A301]
MKNKWRILKIFCTVVLFGFLLSFSLKRFGEAPMKKVSVNLIETPGTAKVYFIDEKNVKDFIKAANPKGVVGEIDIPQLEKQVNFFPSVDSANVYLNLNGNLNIDILQRVPAFRMQRQGQDFYVDTKGEEFPISKVYSHPVLLVSGDIKRSEYKEIAKLIELVKQDSFAKNYFIGIQKQKDSYFLLTSEGNFKVEIGDLDNLELKLKGFKSFVEKFLVYQNQEKYNKISVRYDNQIVTSLNPHYKPNDSILRARMKEFEKAPEIARKKALAEAALRSTQRKN